MSQVRPSGSSSTVYHDKRHSTSHDDGEHHGHHQFSLHALLHSLASPFAEWGAHHEEVS